MLRSVSLSCASCGSNLEVTQEMDRFACGYCGVSQIVQRSGGTITLRRMTEAINLVQAGTDKTAAELALKRLSGELQGVDQENLGLDFRRSLQLQTTRKGFTWIWVGGIVLCLIIGGRGGAAG